MSRHETNFLKVSKRLANKIAMSAWIIFDASAANGINGVIAIPAEDDEDFIPIKIHLSTVKEPLLESRYEFNSFENQSIRPEKTRTMEIWSDPVIEQPTIDSRIILFDGKNYNVINVRHDDHAGDQRLYWRVDVKEVNENG